MLGIMVYHQGCFQIAIESLNLGCLWIIWGGTNVPNSPGETQVVKHPGFKDCCIVGDYGLRDWYKGICYAEYS
jgi:hypothetical protein